MALHTIKGVAATLGALPLAKAAGTLEKGFKDGVSPSAREQADFALLLAETSKLFDKTA
jgi:HPt (histidine-containing phosphotransfer) domain-containing protein